MKIVITHDEKDGLVVKSYIKDKDKGRTVGDSFTDDEEWEDVAFLLARAQLSLKRKKILKPFIRKKDKEKTV